MVTGDVFHRCARFVVLSQHSLSKGLRRCRRTRYSYQRIKLLTPSYRSLIKVSRIDYWLKFKNDITLIRRETNMPSRTERAEKQASKAFKEN